MSQDKITINNNTISMIINNGQASSEKIEDISNFYCLLVGSDVQANDSVCFVMLFKEDMWIVPELSTGAIDLKKWIEPLVSEGRVTVAQIDYLPFSWKARRFCFGVDAKMAIKNKDDFKDIENNISILENASINDIF